MSAYDKSLAAARAALRLADGGLVVTILAPDVSRARMEYDRLIAMLDGEDYGVAKPIRVFLEIEFPETGGKVIVTLPQTPTTGDEDAIFSHLCHLKS